MNIRNIFPGFHKHHPAEERQAFKKLLPENALLSNPRVLGGIGVGMVVLCLFAMQIACRCLSNLPAMLRGEPTAPLLLPSLDFVGWYLLALLFGVIGAAVFIYRINTSFKEMNVWQKGKSRFATFE